MRRSRTMIAAVSAGTVCEPMISSVNAASPPDTGAVATRHGSDVMAGRGPAPKGRRARARDEDTVRAVEADGEARGPELPELPGGESWHPMTVEWWDTWRRSAQAQEFVPTDWSFLIDTALMHHTMWAKARWEFAAELRLRAGKFGATPEDRMRLRMSVQTADSPRPASQGGAVTDIASRRARLSS